MKAEHCKLFCGLLYAKFDDTLKRWFDSGLVQQLHRTPMNSRPFPGKLSLMQDEALESATCRPDFVYDTAGGNEASVLHLGHIGCFGELQKIVLLRNFPTRRVAIEIDTIKKYTVMVERDC